MDVSRREFIGMVSAAAAASGMACSGQSGTYDIGPTPPGDDPLGVRKDFPVTYEINYLNSPYITPSPTPAVEAAKDFLDRKARDPVMLGDMLKVETEVRQKFGRLVGASESEIGILSTTSEGENVVTDSIDWKRGDNVVVDDLHYDTTYVLYHHLAKKHGIDVRVVHNEAGAAPPEAFEKLVNNRTRLVSVSWVSHQNGYCHDLKALADIAHAKNALLYVDAIQGTGVLTLDAKASGVDCFAAGNYKWLLGGFGAAVFYVSESVMDRIQPDRAGWRNVVDEKAEDIEFHPDARKFGYATPAFGPLYQLRGGLDYLLDLGVEKIERHCVALAHSLHHGLTGQGFKVRTPAGNRSPIVAFEHGTDPEMAKKALANAKIRVSFREGDTQIRVGAALFTNQQEVDAFLAVTGSWG
ncbi:MAG: aminotransferase class V-fold PLP-dependent enzyme [Candidatus Latescibacteria bacterium]|nr:aminotransferase class V-fold PLP-dependent enzyme [Candidatus Latescibacterota bacterium]